MNQNTQNWMNELNNYGEAILNSAEFKEAMKQPHHYKTSLGEHMVYVALRALYYCHRLEKRGIQVDTKSVAIGALGHDLGMVGREEKYQNNMQCCHRHPIDSAIIVSRLIPDIDEKTKRVIRHHMWPLSMHPPSSWEEWCVIKADKYVSVREVLSKRQKRN